MLTTRPPAPRSPAGSRSLRNYDGCHDADEHRDAYVEQPPCDELRWRQSGSSM